jgi:hypothetical protein
LDKYPTIRRGKIYIDNQHVINKWIVRMESDKNSKTNGYRNLFDDFNQKRALASGKPTFRYISLITFGTIIHRIWSW